MNKKILVVEDDRSLVKAIVKRLDTDGYTVVSTPSGKEALEILEKEMTNIAGIWLDFDINYYNGLEFMERFVKIDGWEDAPVIIVSNTGDPKKIDRALELGARKYVLKAEARLDDVVEDFIKQIKQ